MTMEFGIIYGNGEREVLHDVVEFGKCEILSFDGSKIGYYFGCDNGNSLYRVFENDIMDIELLER